MIHNLVREPHAAEWDPMRPAGAEGVPSCKCRGWKAAWVLCLGGAEARIKAARREVTQRDQNNTPRQVLAKAGEWVLPLFELCPRTHKCKCILCHHARLISSLSASDMPGDIGLCYETGECVTRVWARRPLWSPWGHHAVWHKGTPPLASSLDEVPARAGGVRSSCCCPAKVRDGGTTAGWSILRIRLSVSAQHSVFLVSPPNGEKTCSPKF